MKYYLDVLKKYAQFKGRTSRKQFWMFILFNVLFSTLLGFIDIVLGINILYPLYSMMLFIPILSILVRRLHDVGNSGWMLLLSLIPIFGYIYLFVVTLQKGEDGSNMYGMSPIEVEYTNDHYTP